MTDWDLGVKIQFVLQVVWLLSDVQCCPRTWQLKDFSFKKKKKIANSIREL